MRVQVKALEAWAGSELHEWDVNNSFAAGELEVTDGMLRQEIIELLIAEGYLKEVARNGGVYIDAIWSEHWLMRILSTEDYQPLYDIMAIE